MTDHGAGAGPAPTIPNSSGECPMFTVEVLDPRGEWHVVAIGDLGECGDLIDAILADTPEAEGSYRIVRTPTV